jgi:hypothetical protein
MTSANPLICIDIVTINDCLSQRPAERSFHGPIRLSCEKFQSHLAESSICSKKDLFYVEYDFFVQIILKEKS